MEPNDNSKREPQGGSEPTGDSTKTVAVFIGPKRDRPKTLGDRLDRLFLEFAWATRHEEWTQAVRTLARSLHGLEGAGLVERERVRGDDGRVLHLVRVTELGQRALTLLSGDDAAVRS
jgi:hypothetical protein